MPPTMQWNFDTFSFDASSGELRGPNGVTRLHDKPALVLLALLENQGAVVSREELQQRLWPGDTHVDFANNLNAAVKRLRDALGDEAGTPKFIETIPRKGYRLIVPSGAQPAPAEGVVKPEACTPQPWTKRKWPVWPVLALVVIFGLAGRYWFQRNVPQVLLPQGKMMLAVLPFNNYSGLASEDDFADGLTEELIAHLGRLQPERMGVISRISAMTYKNTSRTSAQIGAELKVDFILEGSLRRHDNQRRITAQLIQVSDQTHLWAENYDFTEGNLLMVQNQVALRIATTLSLQLLDGALPAVARANLSDTQAYKAYMQGRNAWFRFNGDAYLQAKAHFEEALRLAPDAAIVHAGLADTFSLLAFTDKMSQAMAFEQAKEAANKAIVLDPQLAQAHNALAFPLLYHDRNFLQAELHFRKAVDLNPGFAMAYHWYAGLLSAKERHEEAIQAMQKSLVLDPVSLSLWSDLGWYYLFADQNEDAVTACKETLARNEAYTWALQGLAQAYYQLGLYKQAAVTARQLLVLSGRSQEDTAYLEGPDPQQAWMRMHAVAREKMLALAEQNKPVSHLELAMTCAQLGLVDEAFEWLEKAEQDTWLIFLKVDPRLDNLHLDPRFRLWTQKLGL